MTFVLITFVSATVAQMTFVLMTFVIATFAQMTFVIMKFVMMKLVIITFYDNICLFSKNLYQTRQVMASTSAAI